MKKVKSISEYFAAAPPPSRGMLAKLRKTIKGLVPNSAEVIYYQLPAFKNGRMLVAYGAFSDHCSLFPLSAAIIERFKNELAGYETSRGTIRFPFDKPVPVSLVKRIVRARIEQNRQRDRSSGPRKWKVQGTQKPALPDGLAKPAQRALAGARIQNLRQLSHWTENELRQLHGIGPNAITLLQKNLRSNGLTFAPVSKTKKSR